MNGEILSTKTARELHELRKRVADAIKYIQKDDIALGSFDKIRLLKILRGSK